MESLEQRRLLAADLIDVDTDALSDGLGSITVISEGPNAPNQLPPNFGEGLFAPIANVPFPFAPEGEAEQDLVQFAKDLTAAGVIFFGADWCPHCNATKALFEDGAEYLPFVEVTNFDTTRNQTGIDQGITAYPTWQFPPAQQGGTPTRLEGELTLQEISDAANVPIPNGETPSILPIEDKLLQLNTPLHVAVDAYDPNSEDLTITVSSDNESVVAAEVIQGNRSLEITAAGRGVMIFELFEGRASIATNKIINAAQAGSFDGNPFHRISDSFVIQGGRLTPTPSAINDDFHPDLQHASAGALSYAKQSRLDGSTVDDSGTTQFFITDRATQFLDFNHPVFGQLTDGEDVRKGIQRSITELSNGTPVSGAPAVVMETVRVITDNENGIVKLTPTGQSGTATITVTVRDGDNNVATEQFLVTLTDDVSDAPPFLVDEGLLDDAQGNPQLSTQKNQPITIPLDAIDVEGDPFQFTSEAISNVGNHSISGNILTVTPPANFVGEMELMVTVFQSDNLAPGEDEQIFSISVTPEQTGVLDLLAGSDTGDSNTDNITADTTPTIRVNSVESGALVRLLTASNDVLIQGTATGNSGTGNSIDFTIDLQSFGDGPVTLKATQEINGLVSPDSVELEFLLDTTPPDMGANPAPQEVLVGSDFSFDPTTTEETNNEFVEYTLSNAPANMSIDINTGLIQWTPTPTQRGNIQPIITATDAAGNSTMLTVDVTATGPTDLAFTLAATDINGADPGRPFVVGEIFLLNVFVQDIADSPTGVKNAYFDIVLPVTWSRVGDATFGTQFTLDESGQSASLIDEVGAGWQGTPEVGQFLLAQVPVIVSDGGDYTLQISEADRDSERFTEGVIDPSEIFYGAADIMVISPFTAGLDERSVDEDSADNDLDVLLNDEFISGFTGSLVITTLDTLPTKGQAEIIGNEIFYTPNLNATGGDQFTYVITDDMSRGTVTGTVSVSIQAVNDAPVAVDDQVTNIAEESVDNELDVLANDTDVDGDTLVLLQVNSPANGTATASPNNTFIRYTPNANFEGTETFTYVVSDNKGGTDTGTVTVTVDGANDPPIANNDTATVAEDDSVTVDVLDNDDVVDGGETLSVTGAVAATGTATVVGGTQVVYTPPANFNGPTTVTYTISDGNGFTASATISVTVTPVNDAPTAVDDPDTGSIVIIADSTNNIIDVLANDIDVDNDDLTIVSVQAFSNGGSATVVDGTVRYSPATGVTGAETFTYTIEDAVGETSTATVRVDVLEFVPSSLAGTVFLDVNNNGIQDIGESGLANVTIMLTGTDITDSAVDLTTTTDADGKYEFDTLRAGSYTLNETQPGYFNDGMDRVGTQGGALVANDSISVTLAEGVDGTGNDFAELGRTTEFRSIHDLFRSTSRQNVFVAVNTETGESSHWTEGRWVAPQVTVTVSSDISQVSVTVEDEGELFSSTVAIDSSTPTMVGTNGPIRVLRMFSQQDIASPTPVAQSAEAEGEGENTDSTLLMAPAAATQASDLSAIDAVLADDAALEEVLAP